MNSLPESSISQEIHQDALVAATLLAQNCKNYTKNEQKHHTKNIIKLQNFTIHMSKTLCSAFIQPRNAKQKGLQG
jgi:hypothetical protein